MKITKSDSNYSNELLDVHVAFCQKQQFYRASATEV